MSKKHLKRNKKITAKKSKNRPSTSIARVRRKTHHFPIISFSHKEIAITLNYCLCSAKCFFFSFCRSLHPYLLCFTQFYLFLHLPLHPVRLSCWFTAICNTFHLLSLILVFIPPSQNLKVSHNIFSYFRQGVWDFIVSNIHSSELAMSFHRGFYFFRLFMLFLTLCYLNFNTLLIGEIIAVFNGCLCGLGLVNTQRGKWISVSRLL